MKLDPNRMAEAADQASALLQALGHRHRLLLLCHLFDGERSVGELATTLGIRDTNVSQHLALLRRDGLVQTRRDGQTIWYSVASEPARRVLAVLFEIFCKPTTLCDAAGPARKGRPSANVAEEKR